MIDAPPGRARILTLLSGLLPFCALAAPPARAEDTRAVTSMQDNAARNAILEQKEMIRLPVSSRDEAGCIVLGAILSTLQIYIIIELF